MRTQFGNFVLDSSSRQVTRAGRPVPVSPKAFDLLALLLEQRPNVVTKATILDQVWADAPAAADGNLTVVVAEIRRAIGDDPQSPRFVRTVHRFGYAFCGDATALDAPAEPERREPQRLERKRAAALATLVPLQPAVHVAAPNDRLPSAMTAPSRDGGSSQRNVICAPADLNRRMKSSPGLSGRWNFTLPSRRGGPRSSRSTMSSSSSTIWLVNRAPHPSAAKVFINWLLTRDAQVVWAKEVETNSRRVGIEPGNPQYAVPPEAKFMQIDAEENLPEVVKTQDIARAAIK